MGAVFRPELEVSFLRCSSFDKALLSGDEALKAAWMQGDTGAVAFG
jgi:hypothetical protein